MLIPLTKEVATLQGMRPTAPQPANKKKDNSRDRRVRKAYMLECADSGYVQARERRQFQFLHL